MLKRMLKVCVVIGVVASGGIAFGLVVEAAAASKQQPQTDHHELRLPATRSVPSLILDSTLHMSQQRSTNEEAPAQSLCECEFTCPETGQTFIGVDSTSGRACAHAGAACNAACTPLCVLDGFDCEL